MARALFTAALVLCFGRALADSGGPYVGVPDLKPTEKPPTFAIPAESKPLRFFLTNIPKLRWNKALNEPDAYDWQPCFEHHASVSSLGRVSGREILCIRYTSHRRLNQSRDYADTLLLLARGEDTGPASALCTPVFYTCGGASVYDHVARYYPAERKGAVVVTRWYEGTGAFRDHIYIRGNGDGGFQRFPPEKLEE